MGGNCDLEIQAGTSSEMAKKMTSHVMKDHPDVAETMKNMTEEEHEKWETEFHKNWENSPKSE